MEGDLMFLNLDPVFNIALLALKELNDQDRLTVTNYQRSTLRGGIKSNATNDANQYVFGGIGATPNARAAAFGKTASSVFRMVMLDAVQIPRSIWPKPGKPARRRNRATLVFRNLFPKIEDAREFRLVGNAANRDLARPYWSKYDQIFPHFLIKDKILNAEQGETVNFRNTMLIFRNNLTEVIEIKTNASAREEEHTIRSIVHVICVRRAIIDGEDEAGGYFERLKEYTQQVIANDN